MKDLTPFFVIKIEKCQNERPDPILCDPILKKPS